MKPKFEADREHAQAIASRVKTMHTAALVREQAKDSPSNKAREHLTKLRAEQDRLHRELGKKLAAKASEIQKKAPHAPMGSVYIRAAKELGI